MSRPNVARAAQLYVSWGLSVLPIHGVRDGACACGNAECSSPGKHPTLRNGVHGASRDQAVIAGWWAAKHWANVAIATGAASGLWVVDIDGDEGKCSMRQLELKRGKLPKTVTAKTGGGGLHLFWKLPSGTEVPCRVRVLPGVDVRGNGGFVVAAPSQHVSGVRYSWLEERGPHEAELVEAPSWLLEALTNPRQQNFERKNWGRLFREEIPEGSRNDALARRAGYLLRKGVEPEAVTVLLSFWSKECCRPSLGPREIERTVVSVARREQRRRAAS